MNIISGINKQFEGLFISSVLGTREDLKLRPKPSPETQPKSSVPHSPSTPISAEKERKFSVSPPQQFQFRFMFSHSLTIGNKRSVEFTQRERIPS
jgi:hypothetical protein